MSRRALGSLVLASIVALSGCDRATESQAVASLPDGPSPHFRNVDSSTAYVGDSACSSCHLRETTAYQKYAMARSFHRWTPATRIERPLETPLRNVPSGLSYSVVDSGGSLYQVEFLADAGGKRLHELRRRIDYVMGSGQVAQTYFTEVNGRLFQLPLTWYRQHGWDFSPGYEVSNARFDRLMPDRCISCHASYPRPLPYLEGKYAELRNGIGCERCHGPGALHIAERRAGVKRDSGSDKSIVNPAHLSLQRRVDVCEQCHVHTAVSVLREGKDAFSFMPSQTLHDQWAFFKVSGSIDIVSHADRLRQSACFIKTRSSAKPLECATCHNPHQPPPDVRTRNQPCQSCHASAPLQQRLARSASLTDHKPSSDCVSCHMPRVQERPVHDAFTEHWIRVATPEAPRPAVARYAGGPIEPYFDRDKTGPDAKVYQGMGEVVYATLANNSHVLGDAVAALDSALGKDTTRGAARFLLGVGYQQLGSADQAIRALEQSVRIDSSRPDALRALAREYERAGRPLATIAPLYERALTLQPALAWIRAEYADYLAAQGRRADAEKAYRRAIAEQPDLSVARFNLGTVLAESGRLAESSSEFQAAIHLDPSLAQALSPLIEVVTKGEMVSSVRSRDVALTSRPLRDRGPRGVQLSVTSAAEKPAVLFLNVPARGVVQVLRPDGTLLRELPTGDEPVVRWDLLTAAGQPIAGGLYRARIQGRDASRRPVAPQLLYFAIVRQRGG